MSFVEASASSSSNCWRLGKAPSGHLPSKSLHSSPERSVAGIAISMGSQQGVPKIVGISFPFVTSSLLSCSTDSRWAQFNLSYESLQFESLNSY